MSTSVSLSPTGYYGGAYGINDTGAVVGSSDDHAFLWTSDDALIDLNSRLLNGTGWQYLSGAYAINNAGQIVGVGLLANGDYHAFLLTPEPVPLPGAVLLGLLGLGTAGWRLRKRGME